MASAAVQKKKMDEKHLKILRDLVGLPINRQCFDCGHKGPTYVNMTIGTFVCTSCSGILRGMNPPHRVKSISMSTFTPEEMEFILNRGNWYNQKVWLALYDSGSGGDSTLEMQSGDEQKRKDLMTAKYEKKRWFVEPPASLLQQARAKNEAGASGAAPAAAGLSTQTVSVDSDYNAAKLNMDRPRSVSKSSISNMVSVSPVASGLTASIAASSATHNNSSSGAFLGVAAATSSSASPSVPTAALALDRERGRDPYEHLHFPPRQSSTAAAQDRLNASCSVSATGGQSAGQRATQTHTEAQAQSNKTGGASSVVNAVSAVAPTQVAAGRPAETTAGSTWPDFEDPWAAAASQAAGGATKSNEDAQNAFVNFDSFFPPPTDTHSPPTATKTAPYATNGHLFSLASLDSGTALPPTAPTHHDATSGHSFNWSARGPGVANVANGSNGGVFASSAPSALWPSHAAQSAPLVGSAAPAGAVRPAGAAGAGGAPSNSRPAANPSNNAGLLQPTVLSARQMAANSTNSAGVTHSSNVSTFTSNDRYAALAELDTLFNSSSTTATSATPANTQPPANAQPPAHGHSYFPPPSGLDTTPSSSFQAVFPSAFPSSGVPTNHNTYGHNAAFGFASEGSGPSSGSSFVVSGAVGGFGSNGPSSWAQGPAHSTQPSSHPHAASGLSGSSTLFGQGFSFNSAPANQLNANMPKSQSTSGAFYPPWQQPAATASPANPFQSAQPHGSTTAWSSAGSGFGTTSAANVGSSQSFGGFSANPFSSDSIGAGGSSLTGFPQSQSYQPFASAMATNQNPFGTGNSAFAPSASVAAGGSSGANSGAGVQWAANFGSVAAAGGSGAFGALTKPAFATTANASGSNTLFPAFGSSYPQGSSGFQAKFNASGSMPPPIHALADTPSNSSVAVATNPFF